jgi:hypothetical protein
MTINDIKSEVNNCTMENPDQLLSNHSILGEPEPWESWETSLCLWSIGIAIVALIVLGVLVDLFLLPG